MKHAKKLKKEAVDAYISSKKGSGAPFKSAGLSCDMEKTVAEGVKIKQSNKIWGRTDDDVRLSQSNTVELDVNTGNKSKMFSKKSDADISFNLFISSKSGEDEGLVIKSPIITGGWSIKVAGLRMSYKTDIKDYEFKIGLSPNVKALDISIGSKTESGATLSTGNLNKR